MLSVKFKRPRRALKNPNNNAPNEKRHSRQVSFDLDPPLGCANFKSALETVEDEATQSPHHQPLTTSITVPPSPPRNEILRFSSSVEDRTKSSEKSRSYTAILICLAGIANPLSVILFENAASTRSFAEICFQALGSILVSFSFIYSSQALILHTIGGILCLSGVGISQSGRILPFALMWTAGLLLKFNSIRGFMTGAVLFTSYAVLRTFVVMFWPSENVRTGSEIMGSWFAVALTLTFCLIILLQPQIHSIGNNLATNSARTINREEEELPSRNEEQPPKSSSVQAAETPPPGGALVLNFATPFDNALALIQEVQEMNETPVYVFQKLRDAWELLHQGARNNNLFRTNVGQIVTEQNAAGQPPDFDTLKWLCTLMPDDEHPPDGSEEYDQFLDMRAGSMLEDNQCKESPLIEHATDVISPILKNQRKNSTSSTSGSTVSTSSGVNTPGSTQARSRRNISSMAPAGMSLVVTSEEDRMIRAIHENLDDWSFDVFEAYTLTNGRPLFFIGLVLFKKYNLIHTFSIDRVVLGKFLTKVESEYISEQPYHNSTHGADVARSLHFFIQKLALMKTPFRAVEATIPASKPPTNHAGSAQKASSNLTDLDILASLIAALVHDVGHPGVNNAFLIQSRDSLAIQYNDKSCLENMHISRTFQQIIGNPDCNILANLKPVQFDYVRKIMIEMVLSTDLAGHFDFIGHFKSIDETTNGEKVKLLVLKMALKCSDIAHAAKPQSLHVKWSERIIEEFFRQGDRERSLGYKISPFMDRQNANVNQAQVGFIEFMALPLFTLWMEYLDLSEKELPCLAELNRNHSHWIARRDAADSSKEHSSRRKSSA